MNNAYPYRTSILKSMTIPDLELCLLNSKKIKEDLNESYKF